MSGNWIKEQSRQELHQSQPKKRSVWLWISVVLLLVSFILLLMNPIYQFYKSYEVATNLKAVSLEELEEPYREIGASPEIDLGDDDLYIGKISIPAVEMSLPIVKGSGEENLFRGAATNLTMQEMGKGNYILSAHKMPYREDLLFSPLLKVKKGDAIFLSDGKEVFEYETEDIFVVNPDQVEILEVIPGEKKVTLYTCETDSGEKRHVVQGSLKKVTSVANSDEGIVASLEKTTGMIN